MTDSKSNRNEYPANFFLALGIFFSRHFPRQTAIKNSFVQLSSPSSLSCHTEINFKETQSVSVLDSNVKQTQSDAFELLMLSSPLVVVVGGLFMEQFKFLWVWQQTAIITKTYKSGKRKGERESKRRLLYTKSIKQHNWRHAGRKNE